MRLAPVSRRLLWSGVALILAVNAIILTGAAWNHSAESNRVQLSERELRSPYPWGLERESSARSLHLNWRVAAHDVRDDHAYLHHRRQADWLDAARLRALGFRITDTPPTNEQARRREANQRQAWLVLEFDGDAHAAAVDRALRQLQKLEADAGGFEPDDGTRTPRLQAARSHWLDERDTRSRLFVIDAGSDPHALRARYPDHSRYLIVGGVVGLGVVRDHEQAPLFYTGVIRSIDLDRIHVPARFHTLIGASSPHRADTPHPRYQVELVYGRRYQPWVEAVGPR